MDKLIKHTAQVVAGHCANSNVSAEELPDLIRSVHAAFVKAEMSAPSSGSFDPNIFAIVDTSGEPSLIQEGDDDFEMTDDERAQQKLRGSVAEQEVQEQIKAEEKSLAD